jgi:DNA polymerase III alpha subunit
MLNFCSPHVHPQSLDSASTPEAFAKKEIELGTGTLTCTDHGSLGAAYKTYELAKKNKLTPIIGLEGYFRDDNCPILTRRGVPKTATVPRGMDKDKWLADHPDGSFYDYDKYYHLTLGFQDYAAYLKGVSLLSKADDRAEVHGSERKALFSWDDIEELAATNTTLGSGCLVGMVGRHLINEKNPHSFRAAVAKDYLDRLLGLFKDRFFVELFPHKCSHNYVKGVFIEHYAEGYLSGVEKPVTSRYYYGKTIRTSEGEFKAEELADKWDPKKPQKLLAVKNFHTWQELEAPRIITKVEKKEGFFQNECSPSAPDGDLQWGVNKFMMGAAKKYNLPILVSDDSHFCEPGQKIVQDVKLAQMGDWKFFGSYHRQSSAEAFEYFNTQYSTTEHEFESWVDNSYKWADGFKGFKFDTTVQLPTKFFPEDTLAHTKLLIEKHGRMPKDDPRYVNRLKQEIQLFHRNGTVDLLSYFFVDEEVCELYGNNGMLTGPGRGSAAGTLLAYLLGITHVDPIQYDLSLDRFLTLDRIKSGKYPDIDLDLPSRDLLIEFLDKRYGDCYAQISVMTTLRLSSAVRDVARFTYGQVPQDIEILCKQFERTPQGQSDVKFILGHSNDEGEHPGSIERDPALQAYVAKYPDQWKIVQQALSLPRQRGRHASAFIIASKPISSFIPITTVSSVKVTDFTGPEVESVGGLKMDWLVVSCLNDVQACLQLVREHSNEFDFSELIVNGRRVPGYRLVQDPVTQKFVDVWDLPLDNAVFNDVSTGKTETVFQFNTNSAVQWLKQFNYNRPDGTPAINSIDAMAIFTALDRPGPLDYEVSNPEVPGQKHNIMVEYARRVRGLPGSKDILPIFDKMLPDTNSLMVFQEGLQKVYQELTGCTGSEAEEFRSNIAKKKKDKVDAAYKFFMGKVEPKLGTDQAQQVWNSLATFAQYGFNKSHATAYCVISYACAWLKHYYPLEWWCSVLKNAKKDEIYQKFWPYVKDIVDLPDIKLSKPTWAIVGDRIRAPIDICYGIGETAQAQLNAGAPYESADDFCKKIVEYRKAGEVEGKWRRSAITIGTMHTLLVAGILDSLFDPNLTINERLDQYQNLLKKYTLEAGKKYNKSKAQYPTLDPMGRFQVKKSVLPAYSEDVRGLVNALEIGEIEDQIPEAKTVSDGGVFKEFGVLTYRYTSWSREAREEVESNDRVVGLKELIDMDTAIELPQGGFKCAIVAHVDKLESFSYQNKSKTAKKVFIDACGFKAEVVAWPNQDGGFPAEVKNLQEGSVIVGVITKTDLNKGWSFRKLQLIRSPVEKESDSQ